MPVFEGIKPSESKEEKGVRPSESKGKEVPKPQIPVSPDPLPIKTPASHSTHTERRSRYMLTENLSTPSISGMLSGNQLSGVAEPASDSRNDHGAAKGQVFDNEQLIKEWREFAETVEAPQLKSALSVREPVLQDNFNISYNLDNDVQCKRIVSDVKPRLMAHLHKVLHNELITVEFVVTENKQEILNKPYTNQEKFNTLAAKYPLLNQMKQRFGLEFE